MKKLNFDDKDLAMVGIVVLALPTILAAIMMKDITVAATVFGIAATALGSLATGRKNA